MTEQPIARQLTNPAGLHPAPGFSHIAIGTGSRVAYIAGQTALAPDFSVIGESDLREQTVAAIRNVEICLNEIGASWEHVVRRTIFTTQPERYDVITSGIEEVQGSKAHPAQSIIGITGLAIPGLLIEIEVTVILP